MALPCRHTRFLQRKDILIAPPCRHASARPSVHIHNIKVAVNKSPETSHHKYVRQGIRCVCRFCTHKVFVSQTCVQEGYQYRPRTACTAKMLLVANTSRSAGP
eukprot:1141360-Pelagomonas_calceolata.AAC.5